MFQIYDLHFHTLHKIITKCIEGQIQIFHNQSVSVPPLYSRGKKKNYITLYWIYFDLKFST